MMSPLWKLQDLLKGHRDHKEEDEEEGVEGNGSSNQ